MGAAEQIHALVEPLLASLDLEVFDVEVNGAILRIAVDKAGSEGVDLDTLGEATVRISAELDRVDPMPGRYTLEVSSPGLERTLRTPAHFRKFVGTTVAIKTNPDVEGERRITAPLEAADDDPAGGITVAGRTIAYQDIARARTVFEWGPTPKPVGAPPRTKKHAKKQTKKKAASR